MEKNVLVFLGPNSVITSPRRPNGGIEAHSRILINQLKKKDIFLILICLDEGIRKTKIIKKNNNSICIVLPLRKNILGYFRAFYLVSSQINQISSRYSSAKYIVQSISYLVLAFPKKILKDTYVFVHGIMYREYKPEFEISINYLIKFLKWKVVSFLEYFSYLNVRKIITINDEMKSIFPEKEIFTLNNIPSQDRIKKSNDFFKKKKLILCVGNIIERKNQLNLLKAFLSIENNLKKNWELIFVGKGKGSYIDKLKSLVIKSSNVMLLENIDDKSLNVLLKKTYIFCLPSKSESSPISILEAMCFNCKIIAYKTGGIHEIIALKIKNFII